MNKKEGTMIEVYFDGSCKDNPSDFGRIGAYVRRDGERIKTISHEIEGKMGEITNNVAEYQALKEALLYLIDNGITDEETIVYGDSKMVIRQMSGHFAIRKGPYVKKALETKGLIGKFRNIRFKWIPREQNEIADGLANNLY